MSLASFQTFYNTKVWIGYQITRRPYLVQVSDVHVAKVLRIGHQFFQFFKSWPGQAINFRNTPFYLHAALIDVETLRQS